MPTEIKTFTFDGGLVDTSNWFIQDASRTVTYSHNMLMENGHLISAYSLLHKNLFLSQTVIYSGATYAAWVTQATNPVIVAPKHYHMPAVISGVNIPLNTGSGAGSLYISAGIYSHYLGALAATTGWTSLVASTASTWALTFSSHNVALGDYDDLRFLATGVAATLWGAPQYIVPKVVSVNPDVNNYYPWKRIKVADSFTATTTYNYYSSTASTYALYFTATKPNIAGDTSLYLEKPINLRKPDSTYGTYDLEFGILGNNNVVQFDMGSNLPPQVVYTGSISSGKDVSTLETVIMNDRNELVFGGSGTIPRILFSPDNYRFMATTQVITMINGTDTVASGVTIKPGILKEYRNFLHYISPTILYSDASGSHLEYYPHSVFPSEGYAPYVIDWTKEILIDSPDPITAAIEYRDKFFVFTSKNVYYYDYDSSGNANPTTALNVAGVDSSDAVCVAGDYLCWANVFGAYFSDGISTKKISEPINNLWADYMWYSGIKYLSCTYVKNTGEIFFSTKLINRPETTNYDYTVIKYDARSFLFNVSNGTWAYLPGISMVGSKALDSYATYYFNAANEVTTRYIRGGKLGTPSISTDIAGFIDGTPHVIKAAPLILDYSKNVQTVYLRFLTYAPVAGLTLNFNYYWDDEEGTSGSGTINLSAPSTYRTYEDGVMMSDKVLLTGKGNILKLVITDPNTTLIYIKGIQLEYEITDRRDE